MGILHPHLVKFHVRMDFIFEFSLVFYISLGGSLNCSSPKELSCTDTEKLLEPGVLPIPRWSVVYGTDRTLHDLPRILVEGKCRTLEIGVQYLLKPRREHCDDSKSSTLQTVI